MLVTYMKSFGASLQKFVISDSYCICIFSYCPLPTENHGSTHTQWAHTWWYQAEHCCVSRKEPLPQRGAPSCFEGSASGFTGDWCRNIHHQGQDPLAAWGVSSCHSHSPRILPDQEKSNINNQRLITARVTQIILLAYIPPDVQSFCSSYSFSLLSLPVAAELFDWHLLLQEGVWINGESAASSASWTLHGKDTQGEPARRTTETKKNSLSVCHPCRSLIGHWLSVIPLFFI